MYISTALKTNSSLLLLLPNVSENTVRLTFLVSQTVSLTFFVSQMASIGCDYLVQPPLGDPTQRTVDNGQIPRQPAR